MNYREMLRKSSTGRKKTKAKNNEHFHHDWQNNTNRFGKQYKKDIGKDDFEIDKNVQGCNLNKIYFILSFWDLMFMKL